jgi:hypothetical protein
MTKRPFSSRLSLATSEDGAHDRGAFRLSLTIGLEVDAIETCHGSGQDCREERELGRAASWAQVFQGSGSRCRQWRLGANRWHFGEAYFGCGWLEVPGIGQVIECTETFREVAEVDCTVVLPLMARVFLAEEVV